MSQVKQIKKETEEITHGQIKHERRLVMAIQLAKNGDYARACETLDVVLKKEPSNELAWIWLAASVDTNAKRRQHLQKVMELNPANTAAEEAHNNLVGVLGAPDDIDWDAMSRSAKTKFKDDKANEKIRTLILDPEEEAAKQRRRIFRTVGFGVLGLLLAWLAVTGSNQAVQAVRDRIPGNADVVNVRLIEIGQVFENARTVDTSDPDFEIDDDNPLSNIEDDSEDDDADETPTIAADWLIRVTIKHEDTGDNGRVSGWDIVLPDETILKPTTNADDRFTRRITNAIDADRNDEIVSSQLISLPEGVTNFTVRAHDSVAGWGGETITINLEQNRGEGYRIVRQSE